MRTLALPALVLSTLLATAACSNDSTSSSPSGPTTSPTQNDPTSVASSALSRNTSPTVSSTDAAALVDGDTAFAVDLYKTLSTSKDFAGKNLFFSPHSISVALAMTYAGAHGATETEMASTLHYTLPQASLHNAMNGLDLALASRGANAKAADGQPFRLKVTNSLWGLPKMPFEQPFLDTIATNYGAGVRLTDFAGDPEGSRTKINTWVADQTEQKIKDLLQQGTINPLTRLVLVNAVYFNAAWQNKFEATATHPGTFHGAAGDTNADFMAQTNPMEHVRGADYDAIKLGYDGGELDMVAILPDAGKLDAFESSLDGAKLQAIASSMAVKNVALKLPKFKIEGASFSLSDALGQLGMKQAFDANKADFSGMVASNVDHLYIGDVVHKAFVSVDEKGTEAAAATAVVMAGNAAIGDEPVAVTLDRPFLFGVRDRATGAFVFLGRVATP